MVSIGHSRMGRRIPLIVSLTLAATVLVPTAGAHAQDEPADDTEAFRATVSAARDAAQEQIDEAWLAIYDNCEGLAQEACLQRVEVVQFPLMAQQTEAYADVLEGLDVPDVFADDVAAQVAAARDVASILGEVTIASEAADAVLHNELLGDVDNIAADLASRLSPEYARAAFLSPFPDADFVGVFGDSTPEEIAYLAGIRSVGQAGAANFECFSGALQATYGGTDALLAALYDCGAGTTLLAIEERGKALTPPERFADEHEWWLAAAAEQSRLDGLIGEAAVEGDVIKFLANNVRLSLALRPYPEVDRAYLTAVRPGPVADSRLDLGSSLARSEYGRALFAALVDYGIMSPLTNGLAGIEFPQVPRSEALGAVTEVAPELRALEAELREAIEALEPPEEVAADHALMLDFFALRHADLEKLIEAAAAGDVDATFAIDDSIRPTYCAAVAALSDAIQPVSAVIFTPDDPDCR